MLLGMYTGAAAMIAIWVILAACFQNRIAFTHTVNEDYAGRLALAAYSSCKSSPYPHLFLQEVYMSAIQADRRTKPAAFPPEVLSCGAWPGLW